MLVKLALGRVYRLAFILAPVLMVIRRRNAMDNASKNAGDMIDRLQMQFNRGRQAAITNELVDIITGRLINIKSSFYLLKMSLGASAL